MRTYARLLLVATLFLGALPSRAGARQQPQQSPPQQPAPKGAKGASKPRAGAADPLAEARRRTAISLVTQLADEARNFRDPVLGARVQARAADALWEADKARAQALFRRAWDAAEAADEAMGEARAREAARRAPGSRAVGGVRRDVLRLAARRDGALGTEFLARLDESSKEASKKLDAADAAATAASTASGTGSATPRIDPDDPPSTMMQRLTLADQLLEEGEVERAMQFADPALYPINTFGMNILDQLRKKDAKAADQRYAALAARAGADPVSDANTISLLGSYVFTPFLYVTVRPDGNSHTRRFNRENAPPEDLSPELRNAFFRAASAVLLRPAVPTDQDRSSSGRAGTYVVIARLAPLFEKYGSEQAPALRARMAALQQDTPERLRRADDPLYTRGVVPEDPNKDRVQEALDRLERAKDAGERDRLYFQASMAAAERDLARARELAEKIEDTDTRQQMIAFLDFDAARKAVEKKRPDEAIRLARAGQLTNVQRTFALTEAAHLLAKDEPGRAAEVLEEAAREAKRVDQNSPERAQALVAVVTRLYEVDRARAWDLMAEVVKASNALSDFSGEEGGLTLRVQFKGGGMMTNNFDVESFDLTGIFSALAREDFDRAAELARTLTGESPRSVAVLAVARTVLEPKRRRGGVERHEASTE